MQSSGEPSLTQSQDLHGGQNLQDSNGPEEERLFNIGEVTICTAFHDTLYIIVQKLRKVIALPL